MAKTKAKKMSAPAASGLKRGSAAKECAPPPEIAVSSVSAAPSVSAMSNVSAAPQDVVGDAATLSGPPLAAAPLDAGADAVETVHLDASLEIEDVEGTRGRLLSALVRGVPIRVDVGNVRAIDTAGMQVLLAAQSEALKRGLSLAFCGESAALAQALSILGLQDRIVMAAGQ
jgi:anti-sigma B factor antagonist